MSLFFDKDWFDSRLKATGLCRDDIARALGFAPRQVEELWKDQKELSANDVRILAALLGVGTEELARHAGVSTPIPHVAEGPLTSGLIERLNRIEELLLALKRQVEALRKG